MKARFFLLLLLFIVSVTSCTSATRNLFDFAAADSTFTLTFVSESGEVALSCIRKGDRITAEIISPERSRGIGITVDATSVILSASGADIPLSPEAARGLTSVFDVMFRGQDGSIIKKSEDGEFTQIVYEDGVLTLDSDGLPVAAEVGRAVKISEYVTKK